LSENIIRRLVFGKPVNSILVIGSANADASPVMEHLLRREARERDITVSSAGLSAAEGQPMSVRAASFLAGRAFKEEEIQRFRSRKLSDEMVQQFELLLATSMTVKGFLLFLYPDSTIYTFSEYALIGSDVGEMTTVDDHAYVRICEEMAEMSKRIIARAVKNITF
jgi:protein-tyrosine-phosphatase